MIRRRKLLENGGLLPDGFNVAEEIVKIRTDPLSMEKLAERMMEIELDGKPPLVKDPPPSDRPKGGPKETDPHATTRQQGKFGPGLT